MPGIVGVISRMPRERAVAQLTRMVQALQQESFYEAGTWSDESLGIYLGWALRKGSFCDGLPITNEKQNVTLCLSGSVYSEPQTVRVLKDRGHSIDGRAASYLVHSYEENAQILRRSERAVSRCCC